MPLSLSLSLLSVTLFLVSFPLSHVDVSPWPLIFIALAPLFIALDREDRPLRQFASGAVWGAVMSIGLAYWLAYAMIWEYGVSVLASIAFMIFGLILPHGLAYGLFALTYRFLKDNAVYKGSALLFYVLGVPSLWVLVEYGRELVSVLVPWGFAGYALQPWNLYMQMADVTGLYGISFLVVMINAIAASLINGTGRLRVFSINIKKPPLEFINSFIKKNRVPVAILVIALIAPPTYGIMRRSDVRHSLIQGPAAGKSLNAEVIQANFTQQERWTDDGFFHRINTCLMMMDRCLLPEDQEDPLREDQDDALRQAQGGTPKGIVVWPETVLNSERMIDSKLFSYIRSKLCPSRFLVAGGMRRAIRKTGAYNTAYIISGAEGTAFYDKNILLPYSETAPFGDFMGSFYTAPTEFLRGDTPSAAQTDAGIIGLSICFEAMYSSYIRNSVSRGARLLVNISNDGWFGRTSEPVMHLRQASVRAIENRRYMLRSSNNGFSAIINPAGEVEKRSGLFTREHITGTVFMLETRSLYTLLGDWIIYFALLAITGMFVAIIIKR